MKRISFFWAVVFCTLLLGASAQAQSVVVNKYFNSGTTADVVELLVIQDGLDMRGMILKDFSTNMNNDNGGKYQFSTDTLWASVPAGTLIVLRNDASAADVTVGSGDYNLDIGLQNTTYFDTLVAGFDIATTEMVMIKAAGSGAAGVTSSIHALAGGTAGTQFTNAPTPKLRATGTSGANQFVFATSPTQTIADFNGTNATGAATGLTFGAGNNANNTAYINSLRAPQPTGEPTVQATNVNFTNVAATSFTINWTNGNGTRRLVLVKAGSPVDAAPSDGVGYTANTQFGAGDQIGIGNFVVFSNTGNSVNVTGLAPNTTYHVAVFEYNGQAATADYLITSPATGNQTTAVAYTISGRVQRQNGVGISGATVTLTGATVRTTTTDAAGNYTFTNVDAGGNYTVSATAAGFIVTPATQAFNNLGSNQTADFTGTSKIVISEFRFHGPDADGAGPLTASTNEFIELYNQTDAVLDISGWGLVTSDNASTAKFIAPVGTLIPARAHFLVTGAGYGLAAVAASDGSLGSDLPDNAGVALFNSSTSFTPETALDAVGFSGVADARFRAGTGLAPAGGVTTDGEYSFARKLNSGLPQVTGDNAADFVFIATDGGVYNGAQATLGAPGPENRNSPIQRNGQIKTALVDPQQASSSPPNRLRDTTPNVCGGPNCPLGTLTIRRAFKNNTGGSVTQLRFRIVDITTLGSPNPQGGSQADLRALDSADVTVTLTNGTSVPVKGLTLEMPPAQPLGGGLHSTLAAGSITTLAPLAPGATVNVQFVVGVQQGGSFRFLVNVEAPAPLPPASTSEHLTMGNPSGAITDVNLPFNYLLDKAQYAVSYHRDRGIPNWVSWHLDPTWLGSAPRQNDFRADPTLPGDWYHVLETDYQGSGFDRGHHTPSADRTSTVADNSATFFMTNMMPQAPDNNQGPWEALESYCRTLVNAGNELYIIAGGVGQGGTGSNGGVTQTVANGHVVVPAQTWKVIIVIPQGTDDVNRVTTATRTIAVIMPNAQGIRTTDWHTFRVSVDQVESLTGYDFFSNVPANIQAVIEASVDNQPIAQPALKGTFTKMN